MVAGYPSSVGQDEFNLFHRRVERRLYTALVMSLSREPAESMRVVALFLWLESRGYGCLVRKVAACPYRLIHEIAEEAVACLDFIDGANNQSFSGSGTSGGTHNPLLMIQSLLSLDIKPKLFRENRFVASVDIARIADTVCKRALSDIMEQAIVIKALKGDRTLYFRFSKLQPVQDSEVANFFNRNYGRNCVDFVLTRPARPNEWGPLFALVVLRSASTIDRVLNGTGIAAFTINGREARAAKYNTKMLEIAREVGCRSFLTIIS